MVKKSHREKRMRTCHYTVCFDFAGENTVTKTVTKKCMRKYLKRWEKCAKQY